MYITTVYITIFGENKNMETLHQPMFIFNG